MFISATFTNHIPSY